MGRRNLNFVRLGSLLAISLICLMSSAKASAFLSASRTFVVFPQTEVGRGSFYEYVYVYNWGNETARGLNVSNGCFGDFEIHHDCFMELRPGQSCMISLRFNPRQKGPRSCSITISSVNQGVERVSVQGLGI